ncbi:MAG: tail completion protein gp17 [Alphaproteobacteria bacterium]
MTIETDFLDLIRNDTGVQALVGTKVSMNAAEEEDPPPYIVVTFRRVPEYSLDGPAFETVFPVVQCWGQTSLQANTIADAVTSALHADGSDYCVEERATAFDPDVQFDCAALTCSDIAT